MLLSRRTKTKGLDTATRRQRQRFEHEDVEIMRHHFLEKPSNPVFELLDRSNVEAALAGFDPSVRASTRQSSDGAFSAAVWLGHNEITM